MASGYGAASLRSASIFLLQLRSRWRGTSGGAFASLQCVDVNRCGEVLVLYLPGCPEVSMDRRSGAAVGE